MSVKYKSLGVSVTYSGYFYAPYIPMMLSISVDFSENPRRTHLKLPIKLDLRPLPVDMIEK